ncbi:MAG: hypothetical protein H7X89_16430 [Rhizobiales bacterium]|nr:hypothetical protein [Hyphomicrobiales bacterium]
MVLEAKTLIATPNIIHIPTKRQMNKALKEYSTGLAQLIIEWNYLHENLAKLFCRTIDTINAAVPLAIWHSIRSDLVQRQILRAAAEERYAHEKKTRDEIIWLLDKIDHSLSGKRNDVIHSPISLVTNAIGTQISTPINTSNPRALSLKGKELVKELVWYRDTAYVLRLYARELHRALNPTAHRPWPDRPMLPSPGSRPPAKKKIMAKPRKEHSPRKKA